MSLDPLAQDYPALSDYVYVAGNPIMFIDPTGMSVDDIYVDTDGNYLGEDGDTDNNTIRVVKKSTWDAIDNGVGASSAVGTAFLQHANLSTPLVGVDEDMPGYQKGISISEATWGSIESAGGERATANVSNRSGDDAYIVGEGKMTFGPGALDSNKGRPGENPQLVKDGQDVYGGVDGIKTSLYSDATFKLTDGHTATINTGGSVTTTRTNSGNIRQATTQAIGGGWGVRTNKSYWKKLSNQPGGRKLYPTPRAPNYEIQGPKY